MLVHNARNKKPRDCRINGPIFDDIAPKLGSSGGPGTGSRHIPESVKEEEAILSQGRCRICKREVQDEPGSGTSREWDHGWPHSQGGDATIDNIQSLCRDCNRQKGPKSTAEYIQWLFE